MNIFYLDPDPKTCAEMHISKHVIKMIIEYAQIMSTAHRVLDGEQYIDKRYVHGSLPARWRNVKVWHLPDERQSVLYAATHMNHPSGIWCRESDENYNWLYTMWCHLLQEYTYRYGKVHATSKLINALAPAPSNIPLGKFSTPTPAMPDDVKVAGNSMLSYHNFYNKHKRSFASWQGRINSRPTPTWYHTEIKLMRMYIDTEFNEFKGALISMGIVAEDGSEFYEVLECKNPGNWVAVHVMPILAKEPVDMNTFQTKLQKFLYKYNSVHLVADWPEDIKHFCEALITGPGMCLNYPPLTMECRRDLSSKDSKVPHHALHDARAIADQDMSSKFV